MTFLTIFGVTDTCSFRLVLEVETGKETPESSRLEFLQKFLAHNLGEEWKTVNSCYSKVLVGNCFSCNHEK